MKSKSMRLILVAIALLCTAFVAADANACCGQASTAYYAPAYSVGYAPTYTAAYAPTYTTAYAPATYSTYYSGGWYPGYWWNRATARVWGSPSTYVASYPTAWTASYAPACSSCSTCSAGYAPCSSCSTCTAGYAPTCSTCTAGYAPSCSTCTASAAPCSSCSTVVSYAPSTCSSCSAAPVVTQMSYTAPAAPAPGCSSCQAAAAPQTYVGPASAAASSPQPTPAGPPTQGGLEPKPTLPTTGETTTNRIETSTTPPAQPEPEAEKKESDLYPVDKSGASYLQPPQLFDPKDRTAKRGVLAPVHTAVYQQPVSYRQSSAAPRGPITADQAKQDAIGWSTGK